MPYTRTRRWFAVIGLGLSLALVPSFLAASGALEIAAVGFFLPCAGAMAMLAGVGLYH